MPIRAAIFDFDGVIADSIPLHFESFRRVFADEGGAFTMDDYRRVANGAPREVVIRGMMPHLTPARLQELMDRKGRYVVQIAEEQGVMPIPGALETAAACRRRGLRTAIASSSRTAKQFLDALRIEKPELRPARSLFDAILEREGVVKAKPDPEVFLLAARALDVAPAECVVVEDAVHGVTAARRAGMKVIAITTTDTREALREADIIVDRFDEIDLDALL